MNVSNDIEDGIHFSLPDDVYHSIPALSATGVKNLLISGPDFYYRCPWLNPSYEDDETDSAAMIAGRAYHARILEGREVFNGRYGPTFDAPENCLRTIEDIQTALAVAGVEAKCKRKSEWIEKIRETDPSALLYDDLKEQHEAAHEGKELISGKLIAKIETAAAMIENHKGLSKCFGGGFPEVTIIWQEDGVRFKARIDYLKPRAFSDLKTFENFMNKPIDSAIYSAMASRKYHIQFSFYMRAIEKAKELAVIDEGPANEWLAEFRASEPHGCYAVFQQKGIAPLARGKKFLRGSVWACGEAAIEEAIRRYKDFSARFGALPWIDDTAIDEFVDLQFPAFAVEL